MTSGTFTSLPLSALFVNRETRQRRELKESAINELAESIRAIGLIHPPVVKRDGEIVAGERRFRAVTLLGWTAVPVQYVDELPPEDLHFIELEENLRRVDLTWQEECLAVEEYHRLRESKSEDWDTTKTASALGVSPETVRQKRSVAKAILEGDKRVAEAPKYSTASNIVRRTNERKRDAVLESLDEETPKPEVPLLNANFLEWIETYDGTPFNFLHCDFPYGVNADKHNQGAAKSFGGYEDSSDVYFDLLDGLERAMESVVAPSAHLMFWFSLDFYQITLDRLTSMGWRVNPFPLIWFKSDNTGILPDAARGPRRVYETAFFASRGDRKIVSAVSNCVAVAGREKTIHMSEKPKPMLRHFMRMIVDEYTVMLDPTCGSANAVRVAQDLGASHVLGLEKSEEFFNLAKDAYNDEPVLAL